MNKPTRILLTLGTVGVLTAGVALHWNNRPDAEQAQHLSQQSQMVGASGEDLKLEGVIRDSGLPINNMVVRNVGGVVILRGTAPDRETADRAKALLESRGIQRVANMIRVVAIDDEGLRRQAERRVASTRSLDGCTFAISCVNGVLKVNARIQTPLQEDAARTVLHAVHGVQRLELTTQIAPALTADARQ